MFMTAMLGVVLSDNMVVLYLFWELTSISSFLLIGYWYKRERSRYGNQITAYYCVWRISYAWRLHPHLPDH